MSNRGVDRAKALYEAGMSDLEVRKAIVAEALSIRSAATAMWRARRLLRRRPDGTIKTGPKDPKGADWDYSERVILPNEAVFLAALRAHERPPHNLQLGECSVPMRIGAFVGRRN